MNNNNKKLDYIPPIVKRIILDNEISLALESSPAPGPGEGAFRAPEHIDNNPFKTNLV